MSPTRILAGGNESENMGTSNAAPMDLDQNLERGSEVSGDQGSASKNDLETGQSSSVLDNTNEHQVSTSDGGQINAHVNVPDGELNTNEVQAVSTDQTSPTHTVENVLQKNSGELGKGSSNDGIEAMETQGSSQTNDKPHHKESQISLNETKQAQEFPQLKENSDSVDADNSGKGKIAHGNGNTVDQMSDEKSHERKFTMDARHSKADEHVNEEEDDGLNKGNDISEHSNEKENQREELQKENQIQHTSVEGVNQQANEQGVVANVESGEAADQLAVLATTAGDEQEGDLSVPDAAVLLPAKEDEHEVEPSFPTAVGVPAKRMNFNHYGKGNIAQFHFNELGPGRGIINPSNHCFVSAILQVLAHQEMFLEIYQFHPHSSECQKDINHCLDCFLESCITQIHATPSDESTAVEMTSLLNMWRQSYTDDKGNLLARNGDPLEVWNRLELLTTGNNEYWDPKGTSPFRIFNADGCEMLFCEKCNSHLDPTHKYNKSVDHYRYIELIIEVNKSQIRNADSPSLHSLKWLLEDFFKLEKRSTQMTCGNCDNPEAWFSRKNLLNHCPKILVITLPRLKFALTKKKESVAPRSYQTRQSTTSQSPQKPKGRPTRGQRTNDKCDQYWEMCRQNGYTHGHIKFTKELTMKNYVKGAELLQHEDWQYILQSVVVGKNCNNEGGHFVCYTRAFDSAQWFLFDDEKVKRVTLKEVESQEALILFYKQKKHCPKKDSKPVPYDRHQEEIRRKKEKEAADKADREQKRKAALEQMRADRESKNKKSKQGQMDGDDAKRKNNSYVNSEPAKRQKKDSDQRTDPADKPRESNRNVDTDDDKQGKASSKNVDDQSDQTLANQSIKGNGDGIGTVGSDKEREEAEQAGKSDNRDGDYQQQHDNSHSEIIGKTNTQSQLGKETSDEGNFEAGGEGDRDGLNTNEESEGKISNNGDQNIEKNQSEDNGKRDRHEISSYQRKKGGNSNSNEESDDDESIELGDDDEKTEEVGDGDDDAPKAKKKIAKKKLLPFINRRKKNRPCKATTVGESTVPKINN